MSEEFEKKKRGRIAQDASLKIGSVMTKKEKAKLQRIINKQLRGVRICE